MSERTGSHEEGSQAIEELNRLRAENATLKRQLDEAKGHQEYAEQRLHFLAHDEAGIIDDNRVLKAQLAHVEHIRREQMEADCKLVCAECRKGDEPVRDAIDGWVHPHNAAGKYWSLPCAASAIRSAMPAMQNPAGKENQP